ncbi:MAG: ABC transporter substrate-binding protein [Actinomycetota bacterium]|nr:ABC transporter substrate-binding protein [Actinomycetota bacterium]
MASYKRQGWRRVQRGAVRMRATVVGLTLVAGLVAACGSSDDGNAGASGGTLIIGIEREFGNLDPAIDSGLSGGGFALYLPYAALVTKSPKDGSYQPGLAEKFGFVGEGNTVYELTVRNDAKFADGEPVNAAAVKAWLEHFVKVGGSIATFLDIKSIETPSEFDVRITLNKPTPLVTDYFAGGWGMVISPKALDDPDQLSAGAPGAGPYYYDRSQTVTGKGATYTLLPNKHYFDQDAIKWDKVVIEVIEDPATMLRSMQSGQIDVAQGNVTTTKAVKSAGLDVSSAPGGAVAVNFIDLNGTKTKALEDVRVRQALNYAIDREAITKSLFSGAAEPTSESVTTDAHLDELANYYPYDPEKARNLLAEAGYPDGFTMGIVAPTFGTLSGKPLTQALAQNWADIGVKLKVVSPATQPELLDKFLSESAFILDTPAIPALTLALNFLPGAFTNPYNVSTRRWKSW